MSSSDTDVPTRGPGRPPKAEHRVAVLDATRSLLAERGYVGLTFEAVAQEAGLYRRYVNRSWGSKAELVRDALFADVPDFDVPDTGTFLGDLEQYIRQYVRLNLRPDVLRGLPSLQVELIDDPALLTDTFIQFVQPSLDALVTLLDRAERSGELVSHPDPDLVLACISGTIQQIALQGLLDENELVAFVMRVLSTGVLDRRS